MTPLALLALQSRSYGEPRWLRSRAARIGFALSAAGELVGDKLPMAPSRLSAAPLVGRFITGALSGAVVARDRRGLAWAGALVGASGAMCGAVVGNKLRGRCVRATGLPDGIVALMEDALAIGLGLSAA